jgi:hypothetical protein
MARKWHFFVTSISESTKTEEALVAGGPGQSRLDMPDAIMRMFRWRAVSR